MFKRFMKNFKIEDYLLDLDSAFSSVNTADLNKQTLAKASQILLLHSILC